MKRDAAACLKVRKLPMDENTESADTRMKWNLTHVCKERRDATMSLSAWRRTTNESQAKRWSPLFNSSADNCPSDRFAFNSLMIHDLALLSTYVMRNAQMRDNRYACIYSTMYSTTRDVTLKKPIVSGHPGANEWHVSNVFDTRISVREPIVSWKFYSSWVSMFLAMLENAFYILNTPSLPPPVLTGGCCKSTPEGALVYLLNVARRRVLRLATLSVFYEMWYSRIGKITGP